MDTFRVTGHLCEASTRHRFPCPLFGLLALISCCTNSRVTGDLSRRNSERRVTAIRGSVDLCDIIDTQ